MRALRSVVALAALAAAAAPASAAPVGTPQTLAAGLAVPWDVLGLPDGRVLISERSERRIRVVGADGVLRADPVWSEPAATKVLGMDRHPGYASNRWIYVYVTYPSGSKVVRLVDEGATLRFDRVIFDRPIVTDGSHDGGRIRFGPDGRLYVTTGDVHDPALPRDVTSLNGKILRLADDGSAPPDNPFAGRGDDGRYVLSLGHRHPQGIAWDATGRLWESEHGPSGEGYAPPGERTGNDEINLIVPGGDYGWPQSSGAVVQPGTRAPAWVAGDVAVAPGGMVFAPDGRLYVPMLAGRHLHVFRPDGDSVVDEGALYPGVRLRAASMLGCRLAFSTDKQSGATDEVRSVAIEPCPAPLPPAPGPPAAPPPGGTTPAGPVAARAADAGAASLRLLRRVRAALRRLGLRRLAGRQTVTVRGGGLSPGTLAVRVRLVPAGGRPLTVAFRRLTVASRAAVTVRLATTRSGRARLRRLPSARVRVTVAHRALGAVPATRGVTFTVARAGVR